MEEYLKTLSDAQKAAIYLKMVDGLHRLISPEIEDTGLDAGDRKEVFDEFQNVIFQLRKCWKDI